MSKVSATPSTSNTTLWLGHRTNRSIRTEEAYVNWTKRYIYFHNVRHPAEMGAAEVEAFLTHLAVKESVAASTQNQAFSPWAKDQGLRTPPPALSVVEGVRLAEQPVVSLFQGTTATR